MTELNVCVLFLFFLFLFFLQRRDVWLWWSWCHAEETQQQHGGHACRKVGRVFLKQLSKVFARPLTTSLPSCMSYQTPSSHFFSHDRRVTFCIGRSVSDTVFYREQFCQWNWNCTLSKNSTFFPCFQPLAKMLIYFSTCLRPATCLEGNKNKTTQLRAKWVAGWTFKYDVLCDVTKGWLSRSAHFMKKFAI